MLRGGCLGGAPFFAEKECVMKSFTMFGSHVCPDTIAAMCILDQKGFSYTYKDITGTMIFLKEFLHLRDSREAFQAVKDGGYVGIPCFLFEDGSLTFSVDEAIAWSGQA
ncbi:MAG: hypothetical protein KHX13_03820 [Acidaminococcus intestini]|uniref:Glutaredoxin domain-containing protein n=2 Tax=Acidaminococcus TaxID=904 RepID=A0A943EG16_9FIRM|nr:hypothetical protein [Acidaminococcus intestini]